MPLDPQLYTPRHTSPRGETKVAFIAYERRDGPWDVFVFEPVGVCPLDWERVRVDAQHLHVATIDHPDRLDEVVTALEARLDDTYDRVPAFHCPDPSKRGGIGLRINRLHKAGCTGYAVRHDPGGGETLWIRRKDLPVLSALAPRPDDDETAT